MINTRPTRSKSTLNCPDGIDNNPYFPRIFCLLFCIINSGAHSLFENLSLDHIYRVKIVVLYFKIQSRMISSLRALSFYIILWVVLFIYQSVDLLRYFHSKSVYWISHIVWSWFYVLKDLHRCCCYRFICCSSVVTSSQTLLFWAYCCQSLYFFDSNFVHIYRVIKSLFWVVDSRASISSLMYLLLSLLNSFFSFMVCNIVFLCCNRYLFPILLWFIYYFFFLQERILLSHSSYIIFLINPEY